MVYKNGDFILEEGEKANRIYDNKVKVMTETGEATLSYDTIRALYMTYWRKGYHRENVIDRIDDMVQCGDLPAEAGDNEEYIDALTNDYSWAMFDNFGLSEDEVLGWDTILDDVFERNPYSNYEKEKEVKEGERNE